MSRPAAPGIETGQGAARPMPWTMERPLQVGECIGCQICVRECPVSVITLATQGDPTPLASRQGPVHRPPTEPAGWSALSEVTLESLKPAHPSPWGDLFQWVSNARSALGPDGMLPIEARPAPVAPCQEACPAGTDAGRYVGLVARGRFDDAYAVAAEVNPFPSVCGWICTAPCEAACRRGVLDEPISIRTIKRFAAEHGTLPPVAAPARTREGRVAIVGGGPAGMSAAWYLARLGYPVTVFEAMPVPGGMMAIGIPAYRLPRDVLQAEIARIVELGVDLRLNAAMGRDFTLNDLRAEGFAAIFLATGASKSRRLGVPGDEADGVIPATLFLKQVNLGESPQLSGPVVVVGGGSTAMDAARSALRSGAESVVVAYRRRRAEMPAQAEEVEAAEREGIEIRTELVVGEVVVHDGAAIALRCSDAGSPAGFVDLPARAILVAIGEEPDPSILPEGTGIEISGWAGVVADARTMATGQPGVFAGGDVVSGPKTIIDAVAAGRRAAGSIHGYLAGVADPEAEILRTVRYATAHETELTVDLSVRPRAHAALNVVDPRSFAPTQAGYEPAAAVAEAGRCFRCDAVDRCSSVHVVGGRGPADRPVPNPPPTAAVGGPVSPAVPGGVQ
jgi:NADPH-dependent glutamate synthase beta subunit-like oxidoreductase